LDVNEALYGKRLTNRELVHRRIKPPAAARRLLAELSRYPLNET
jgi:lipid-binding SYLF domain-containing protein